MFELLLLVVVGFCFVAMTRGYCRFNHVLSNSSDDRPRRADRFVSFESDRSAGIAATINTAEGMTDTIALSYYYNDKVVHGVSGSINGSLRHMFMTDADSLVLTNDQGDFFVMNNPRAQVVSSAMPMVTPVARFMAANFSVVAAPNNHVVVVGGMSGKDAKASVCIALVEPTRIAFDSCDRQPALLKSARALSSLLGTVLEAPFDDLFVLFVAGGASQLQPTSSIFSDAIEVLVFAGVHNSNGSGLAIQQSLNNASTLVRARIDSAVVIHRLDRHHAYFVVVAGGEHQNGTLSADLDVFKFSPKNSFTEFYRLSDVPGNLSRGRTRIVGVTVANQLLYTGGFVEGANRALVPADFIEVWDAELEQIRMFAPFAMMQNPPLNGLIALPFGDTAVELYVGNSNSTMTRRSCWSWPFDARGESPLGVVLNNTWTTIGTDLGLRVASTISRSVLLRFNGNRTSGNSTTTTSTLIDTANMSRELATLSLPLFGPNVTGVAVVVDADYACIVGHNVSGSSKTIDCWKNGNDSRVSTTLNDAAANAIVVALPQGFAVIGGLDSSRQNISRSLWIQPKPRGVMGVMFSVSELTPQGAIHLFGAASLIGGGCILVSGGLSSFHAREPQDQLTVLSGFGPMCNVTVPSGSRLGIPRFMHSSITIDGLVYVVGGFRTVADVVLRDFRVVPQEPLRSVEVFGIVNGVVMQRTKFLLFQTGGAVAVAAFRDRFLLVAGGGLPWRSQIGWNGVEVVDTWSGESIVYVASPLTPQWELPQPFAVNRAMISPALNMLFATCEQQTFSSHCDGVSPSQVLKLSLSKLDAAHLQLTAKPSSFCSTGGGYNENKFFVGEILYIVVHLPSNFTTVVNIEPVLANVGFVLKGDSTQEPRAQSLQPHIGFEQPNGKAPFAMLYWNKAKLPMGLPFGTNRSVFHVTVHLGVNATIEQLAFNTTSGSVYATAVSNLTAPPWSNDPDEVNRVSEPRIVTGIGTNNINATNRGNFAVSVHADRSQSLERARQWLLRIDRDMSDLCATPTSAPTTSAPTPAGGTTLSPPSGSSPMMSMSQSMSSNATTTTMTNISTTVGTAGSTSAAVSESIGGDSNQLPAIIGGAIGGCVVLLLIVALIIWIAKRRRSAADDAAAPSSSAREQREMSSVSSNSTEAIYGKAPPLVSTGSSEYGSAPAAVNGDDYMKVGAPPQGAYGNAAVPGYDAVPSASALNVV